VRSFGRRALAAALGVAGASAGAAPPGAAAVPGFAHAGIALAAGARRPFAEDDVYRVVSLSSPQLSPDGARVLVTVRTADRENDRWVRRLDAVDVATGARRTLSLGAEKFSSPRWSPSGDRIAYIASGGVWIADANGENGRRVTDAAHDVVQFAWRPDGNALAFVALDLAPAKSGDARYLDAYEVGNDAALADGPRRLAHLWFQPLDGGAARALGPRTGSVTSGDAESTLSWSPDGTALAYLRAPTNLANDAVAARVRIVDVARGTDRALPGPADEEHDPLFSPDGTQLAYAHSDGDDQLHPVELFVTTPQGGPARNVSHAVDRALRDVAWQPGSSTLWFTVPSGTRHVLYRISTNAILKGSADGTPRRAARTLPQPVARTMPQRAARTVPQRAARIIPQRADLGALSISSGLNGAIGQDGTVAFVAQTSQRPDELYMRAPDGAVKRLTGYNDGIVSLALATTQRITYRTSLGVDGDAVLTKPPGFRSGVKYPLVVVLHGGPTSASTETFDPLDQLLAARGWLVLEPNYRGSNNLGARYQGAVGGDKLRGPGTDVDAALAAVRALGIVDGTRLAVSGWSYGAGLTLWMTAHRHDWRAAVAGAAVTDIAADYSTADDIAADRALVGGSPFTGRYRARAAAMSPIAYAARVRTPLLLMTCRGDTRVSPVGTYEFYHALRDLGRDVRLVAYPIDGHFPSDPVRRADVYRRWAGFIAQRFGS
jgi:dipeptidyl aminopeptidase/acylaminoacyl peptidase